MAEIGNGYSWFKFDINGWLTSPEINEMTFHEEGLYLHLLAVQGRDGTLLASPDALSAQVGKVDRRVLKTWLKKWGFLVPIIEIVPNAEVKIIQHACSSHAPSGLQACCKCVTSWMQVCYIPAASWMQGGSRRVNPKLWNLSVESGKNGGQPFLEENRRELDENRLDENNTADKTYTRMTLKSSAIYKKLGS